MTALADVAIRKRNAAATREALLAAATSRFARDGYDSVSLREIASEAGVDVALVSRYFGGKEELFQAVLEACPPPIELFSGDQATWGERVARMLVEEPQEACPGFDILLVMLRSASSPNAALAICKSGEQRFFGPFAAWLGGPDAPLRARLAGDIIKGVTIDRRISDDFGLDAKARRRFQARLAAALQSAISP